MRGSWDGCYRPGVSNPWVLVVEDDADNRDTVVETLRDAGLLVLGARSPAEALSFVDAGPRPSVIVTDYVMPGMDGLAFVRELRGPRGIDVPVILTTAMPKRALPPDLGVPVLEKPYSHGALVASVRAALVRTAEPTGRSPLAAGRP